MKVKLSAVIITFNEEKNIERCINSIIDIADDIVVVDSFSSDRTKEICQSKGVRFVEHKFEGHIQQKNWAITQALYPHVLSLDADEAPDDKLKKSILDAKENFDADGYTMNRLTNYCGHWVRHCGWYPDKKLRLWDSRKGSWTGLNPHDCFKMESGSKIKHLDGDLLHYSYYTKDDHLKQIEKFTDILGKSMFEAGRKTSRVGIIAATIFKFFRDYFLKLGFLDGKAGFNISWLSAGATFKKYRKLLALQKNAKNMKNISIWASGNGSNAENIIKYFDNHKNIKIDHIICNNSKAGVIERAQRLNVDCFVFSRKDFSEGNAVLDKVIERKTDYIVLSGFLQMVPANIINKFPNAIINIHPALLPDFGGKGMYGSHVHEAVINSKKSESGITIHLVDEIYDHGKIIFQEKCEINENETPESLAEKIHKLEYKYFPKVIEDFILRK